MKSCEEPNGKERFPFVSDAAMLDILLRAADVATTLVATIFADALTPVAAAVVATATAVTDTVGTEFDDKKEAGEAGEMIVLAASTVDFPSRPMHSRHQLGFFCGREVSARLTSKTDDLRSSGRTWPHKMPRDEPSDPVKAE